MYQEVRIEHAWETSVLQSFSKMQQKIVYKLIHAEENAELLEQIPHMCVLDLAIVFYVLLDVSKSGTATILITDDIVKCGEWKRKNLQHCTSEYEKASATGISNNALRGG